MEQVLTDPFALTEEEEMVRSIVDFFGLPHNPNPIPDDPISVTRAEFEAVCDQLESVGVPLKPDRDQAWRDFAGWRVNYDTVLRILAGLTMAPEAPWSSDRAIQLPVRLFLRPVEDKHFIPTSDLKKVKSKIDPY